MTVMVREVILESLSLLSFYFVLQTVVYLSEQTIYGHTSINGIIQRAVCLWTDAINTSR